MGTEMLVANLWAHWIQAGVLSLVTLAALHLLRVKDPRLTLAALHVVLVLIVLLPWVQRRELREAPAPVVLATATATGMVDVSAPLDADAAPSPVQRPVEPSAMALGVIAAGIALRFAWLLLGFVRLHRFARETRSIAIPAFAEEAHALVGVTARYLEHPTAGSPSTFGIFSPRVVLPARFAGLTSAHQEGALLHELIHVRRHDVAAALAEEIFTALFWFHPWIWVIRRRIRMAREQVVDMRVLALTGNRTEYVRCLIEMSGHDLIPHLSHAGTAMVRSNELRARVDAIFQEVRMSRSRFVAVSAVMAAVVGTAAWIASTQAPLYATAVQSAPSSVAHDQVGLVPAAPTVAEMVTVQPTVVPTGTNSATFRILKPAAQAAPQQGAPGQFRRLIKVAYSDYPSDALDKQISGTVKITIVVNPAGDVTVADVTSGPPELRSSAFKAAMGLKYSPGADTARINIAVEYRLDPQGWGVRVIQEDGTLVSAQAALAQKLQAVRVAVGQLDSPAVPAGAVRVGGAIAPPKKTKDAPPIYPPEAKEAGVQGVVIMEATIDEAGNVSDVKVLRSIPLLDQAAIDAVKQWQYTPTLMNGVAIPVLMTVTVNFTLRADPNVTLNIGLPTGGSTAVKVMDQAGVGMVDVPNVGKFGFTPIRGASPTGRTIVIYQITEPGSPLKNLGTVQVELNGGVVQSPTTPSFGVELAEIP